MCLLHPFLIPMQIDRSSMMWTTYLILRVRLFSSMSAWEGLYVLLASIRKQHCHRTEQCMCKISTMSSSLRGWPNIIITFSSASTQFPLIPLELTCWRWFWLICWWWRQYIWVFGLLLESSNHRVCLRAVICQCYSECRHCSCVVPKVGRFKIIFQCWHATLEAA